MFDHGHILVISSINEISKIDEIVNAAVEAGELPNRLVPLIREDF
jgi:hypothetical protein